SDGGPQGVHRQLVTSGKAFDGRLLRKRREAVAGDHGPDHLIASPEGAADDAHAVVFLHNRRIGAGETRPGALAEERGIPTAMRDRMEERGHVDRAKEMRVWRFIDADGQARGGAELLQGGVPRRRLDEGPERTHAGSAPRLPAAGRSSAPTFRRPG